MDKQAINIVLHPPRETYLLLKRNYILNPLIFFNAAVAHIVFYSRESWAPPGASTLHLPPVVMGQGTVSLSRLVHVVLLLDHRALVVKSLQQLMQQLL